MIKWNTILYNKPPENEEETEQGQAEATGQAEFAQARFDGEGDLESLAAKAEDEWTEGNAIIFWYWITLKIIFSCIHNNWTYVLSLIYVLFNRIVIQSKSLYHLVLGAILIFL